MQNKRIGKFQVGSTARLNIQENEWQVCKNLCNKCKLKMLLQSSNVGYDHLQGMIPEGYPIICVLHL